MPVIVPLTQVRNGSSITWTGIHSPKGCSCRAQHQVHQQANLHPYPKKLMPRNHEWIQSSLADRKGEGFVATLLTVF